MLRDWQTKPAERADELLRECMRSYGKAAVRNRELTSPGLMAFSIRCSTKPQIQTAKTMQSYGILSIYLSIYARQRLLLRYSVNVYRSSSSVNLFKNNSASTSAKEKVKKGCCDVPGALLSCVGSGHAAEHDRLHRLAGLALYLCVS